MVGIGGSDIARRIAGRHRGTDITIGSQHRARNIHAPGFTIRIDGGLVGLGTDFHGDRITGFNVIADVTGHRNGLTRFAGINHVIGGDIVDRDRRYWRNGIHRVSVIRVGGGDVACGIACSNRGRDIAIGR
ncbi:hypothetical protein PB72LOC_04001 [Pectobacterium atrosepticum]|nr:hypothetical protein PB72LOC_04001 [Pectobacterium atrosepticum]